MFKCLTKQAILALSCVLFHPGASAQVGVYSTLEDTLAAEFPNADIESKTLWLTKDIKAAMSDDLGFSLPGLRMRYWQSQDQTLWVLEEIGKEYPITFSYLVEGNISPSIASAEVMEYREIRGGEVRHRFFTKQFVGANLTDGHLSQTIDGITGATLSVNAMRKMAKTAIWLHSKVMRDEQP